jgi:hypothetical protein
MEKLVQSVSIQKKTYNTLFIRNIKMYMLRIPEYFLNTEIFKFSNYRDTVQQNFEIILAKENYKCNI